MVLAAGLWWLYSDSAARINLKILDLSGGSPTMANDRFDHGVRLVVLIATFQLARLRPELAPDTYLILLAGWVAMCALLTTSRSDEDDEALARFLR